MGTGAPLAELVLAGREAETSEVQRFLDGAVHGSAGTLLVVGDAGVGKTSLVEHSYAKFADEMTVLVGRCLPLTTMSVPFLPLRSALRDARVHASALPTYRLTATISIHHRQRASQAALGSVDR